MNNKIARKLAPAVFVAAALVAPAQPATADDLILLPAGLGCPDFILGISSTGGNLHVKEFTDADGNLVRNITAGKGVLLTYTNYGTKKNKPVAGKSVTIRTDGSVSQTVTNPDGTQTVTATGHNGLILFPSDVPAGPTTTQYIGQIEYTIDPSTGVFTLVRTSGQERDICAELA
jgi:hypothetical protein